MNALKKFSHFVSVKPAIKHPKTGKITVAKRGQNHQNIKRDPGLDYEHGYYNTQTNTYHSPPELPEVNPPKKEAEPHHPYKKTHLNPTELANVKKWIFK